MALIVRRSSLQPKFLWPVLIQACLTRRVCGQNRRPIFEIRQFGIAIVSMLLAIVMIAPPSAAQEAVTPTPEAAPAAQPAPTTAPVTADVKQIQLTEAQVKSFIKAQADLAGIASKIQSAGEQADPALQAELEGIATRHGFSTFAELDDVAANISIVMAGLDSASGNFVDPVEALQKELDDVKKDDSIPEADKKQLVDELTEAIKTTPPLQFKVNIEIVKTNRAEIEKALQ